MNHVTQILKRIESGDSTAIDELLPLVYDELRSLAKNKVEREKSSESLQATALVHEAYLRRGRNGPFGPPPAQIRT